MRDSKTAFIDSINLIYQGHMLTDVDIARIIGVHRETIYRMRKKGQGPAFIKCGRKAMCLKQDFFEWFFSSYSKNISEEDTVEST